MTKSEAEIEAYTVGPPRVLGTTVTLEDYDPAWPDLYRQQAAMVRDVLGPAVLRLEHIGSTSVPGLAAKPVIDIMLVVPDTADEEAYVPALKTAGFRLAVREPDWHEHRTFMKRIVDGDDVDVNLHTYPEGCVRGERDVLFRTWLREHDEDRELYERTKRALAAQVWKYMQNYADAKTTVIEDIRSRAGEPAGSCTRC
ncbi:GrpB family protein [Nonomuraea sp. NPDC004297]